MDGWISNLNLLTINMVYVEPVNFLEKLFIKMDSQCKQTKKKMEMKNNIMLVMESNSASSCKEEKKKGNSLL